MTTFSLCGWDITIIVDEVTGSGKGEIEVTAVLLTNYEDPPGQSGFYKQQVAQVS